MKIKNTIQENVILPSEFDDDTGFDLSLNENLLTCRDCGSPLCYTQIKYGVVAEINDYGILGNKNNRTYNLRAIGFNFYCAKCGRFHDDYSSYLYDNKSLIVTYDEIENVEKTEVEYCLLQFNQKRDFIPGYDCLEVKNLKEKLLEYEKKNPYSNEDEKLKLNIPKKVSK